MLTYLRLLAAGLAAGWRVARAEHAARRRGVPAVEPQPAAVDTVGPTRCVVLTPEALGCTCLNPAAEPWLWRDPGCPVHSNARAAN